MRLCSSAPCPNLVEKRGPCPEHAAQYERRRGSRQARGYDAEHDRLRAEWKPHVEAGEVDCWRCGERIRPGEAWDLGHDDHDRTIYRGPEHAGRCNRAAAGRRAHHR